MTHAPKGLATVALLKTRLDEGHDHLGLFEPLILDALLNLTTQDFVAADIKALLNERSGVLLPTGAIQTLLGRCKRQGLLQRAGGRYFRTSQAVLDPGIDAARGAIQKQQAALGREFAVYAAAAGIELDSAEAALEALATFVSDNKVHLILNEAVPDSPLERSSLRRKLTRVIARFITDCCLRSPELRTALQALTEGILLHDTLLLSDIPKAAERFQNLLVVFDTPVLFSAIDLHGVANGIAAKEGLALLREAGARTVAFDRTVAEMRKILSVYEGYLRTTEGRLNLRPTPLAHHALTARLSPADFREISATLEKRLAKVGVSIQAVPPHNRNYTLNENALAQCLADPDRPDTEVARVRHDVDSIAGVLTLRAGRTATSIERSRAILCTSSGRVVRNVQQWFFAEGEQGVPPIVHQAALTSIAWLKKPAAAPNLKMHELAALCAAAMRPTRATWAKFVDALRRLRTEGNITDDETAAIVASELTEPLLARLDDDFEPDSDSIGEAIERVREGYRRESSVAAEEAVRRAQAEAGLAQRAATEAIARSSQIRNTIEARIVRSSRRAAKVLFAVLLFVTVLAAFLSIPGVFEGVGGVGQWIARAILILAAFLGVYTAVRGTSLDDLRARTEEWFARRIRNRWLPESELVRPAERSLPEGGPSDVSRVGSAPDDRPESTA